MIFKIDGKEYESLGPINPTPEGRGVRVFCKPKGEKGGPWAQHDVPTVQGKFRTNGHVYEFPIN